jgi:hypothetical protein
LGKLLGLGRLKTAGAKTVRTRDSTLGRSDSSLWGRPAVSTLFWFVGSTPQGPCSGTSQRRKSRWMAEGLEGDRQFVEAAENRQQRLTGQRTTLGTSRQSLAWPARSTCLGLLELREVGPAAPGAFARCRRRIHEAYSDHLVGGLRLTGNAQRDGPVVGQKVELSREPGLFEVLYTCRAMRRLKSDPVPRELVLKLIDAANQAPSGSNQQRALDRRPGSGAVGHGGLDAVLWQKDHMHELPVLIIACREYPAKVAAANAARAGGSV